MKGCDGAVQDGQFQRVDFDVDVVHAAGVERGKQMLGGGEQHALFHQAGGVADARDVAHVRFDLKIVEVHAAEDDPVSAGAGTRRNLAIHGGVEADSFGLNGPLNRGLVAHSYYMVASCRPMRWQLS